MKLQVFLKRSHRTLESLKVLLESHGVDVFTNPEAASGSSFHTLLYQSDQSQESKIQEIQRLSQAHPGTPLLLFGIDTMDPATCGLYFRAGVTDFIPKDWENDQIFQKLLQFTGISIRFLTEKNEGDFPDSDNYHTFQLSKILHWFPQGNCAFPLYIRTPLTHTLVKYRDTHESLNEMDIKNLRYQGIHHCWVPRGEFLEWSDLPQMKKVA